MKQWNLIIDVAKCSSCNNCVVATKDEHVGNDFPGYAAPQPLHGHHWIDLKRKVRGQAPAADVAYLPTMCAQCDNAPCLEVATGGAVFRRSDGIVIIDPEKAVGQRQIVEACPYGAVWWNEELNLPQKWIFDAHLLDQGWTEPRCVQVCPTQALRALKVSDAEMARVAREEGLQTLLPDRNLKPRVYYRNLHLFESDFIAGSAVAVIDGVEECLDGATVDLLQAGRVIATMVSDTFGDFKFDGLTLKGTVMTVRLSHADFGEACADVEADESLYLGALTLTAPDRARTEVPGQVPAS